MDLTLYVGMGGAPMIERFVEYLKQEWKLPTYLAPFAAILIGVVFNVGLGMYLANAGNTPFNVAHYIETGIFTGLFASGWHEIAKKD